MKSLAVTIGIPAYNEEANIAFLLEDILKQRQETFQLKKILVISDGSADATADIARRYESSGVCVKDDGERKGKAMRLNEIFDAARSDSDVVILLDADISLVGDRVLECMVRDISRGADLVSPELLALSPRTRFGRAIVASHNLKRRMFAEWKSGETVYSCHGAARGFSKRLFSVLRFKESVGEDAYSYFFAKQRGFRYARISDAAVSIRVPETLRDHKRQSRRFVSSKEIFFHEFGRDAVLEEYRYPKSLLVKNFLKSFFLSPGALSRYVCTMAYLSITPAKSERKELWDTVSSSKALR